MSAQPTAVPLKTVAPRRRLGQGPFLAGLGVMVIAGMTGVLLLSITIQTGSYELRQTQAQVKALSDEAAVLSAEADRVGSVTNLAVQAAALGMVPNPHGAFITLPDGRVTGDTTPVKGNEMPDVVPGADADQPPVQIKVYPVPSAPVPADGPINAPNPTPTPTPTPSDSGTPSETPSQTPTGSSTSTDH